MRTVSLSALFLLFGVSFLIFNCSKSDSVKEPGAGPGKPVKKAVLPAEPDPAEKPAGEIVRAAALSGRVVAEESEAPISGATVAVWRGCTFDWDKAPPSAPFTLARSDKDGRFTVPVPGDDAIVTLVVSAPGRANVLDEVLAEEGEEGIVIRLGRCATIRGTVLGLDGKPVPGIEVFAAHESLLREWRRQEFAKVRRGLPLDTAYRTVTDRQGRFVLEGLCPEEAWDLYAWDKEGNAGCVKVRAFPETGGTQVQDVKITGCCTLALEVQIPGGALAPRVRMTVHRLLDGEAFDCLEDLDLVQKEATWTLRELEPGAYKVTIWPGGYCPQVRTLKLERGVTRVEIPAEAGLRVAGIVVDEAGAPISGAAVSVVPEGVSMGRDAASNPDGRFSLDGFPGGRVAVRATAAGRCEVEVAAEAGSEDLSIALKPFPVFFGSLDTADLEKPLPEVRIRFFILPGLMLETSVPLDEKGAFLAEWSGYRKSDRLQVLVKPGGWAPVVLGPFTPEPGGRIDFGRITKPEARTLAGSVEDPDGKPVPGATVALFFDDVFHEIIVKTDAEGRFEIKAAPMWKGMLVASIDNDPTRSPPERLEVGAKDTGPIRIAFKRGGIVKGRVVSAKGTGCPDCKVHFVPVLPDASKRGCMGYCPTTGPGGRFKSLKLAPGRYVCAVVKSGEESPVTGPEVLVKSGETTTVEIRLPE